MAPETLERLLVVLVDDWPLIALGAQEERSSVVVASQRVIAASPMARAGGVAIGQRQRDAERLVPTLEVLTRDPAREVHRFEPIVHCLSEITPTVMLGEPGWIALPTRGPARYFGGEEMLAEEVAICLHALEERQGERFPWRCGIADGLFAATLAAERKVVVTPGESAQFLAPLPIALLRDIALESTPLGRWPNSLLMMCWRALDTLVSSHISSPRRAAHPCLFPTRARQRSASLHTLMNRSSRARYFSLRERGRLNASALNLRSRVCAARSQRSVFSVVMVISANGSGSTITAGTMRDSCSGSPGSSPPHRRVSLR